VSGLILHLRMSSCVLRRVTVTPLETDDRPPWHSLVRDTRLLRHRRLCQGDHEVYAEGLLPAMLAAAWLGYNVGWWCASDAAARWGLFNDWRCRVQLIVMDRDLNWET